MDFKKLNEQERKILRTLWIEEVNDPRTPNEWWKRTKLLLDELDEYENKLRKPIKEAAKP